MSLQKFPAPVLCETCFSLQPVRIYLFAAPQSLLALSLSIWDPWCGVILCNCPDGTGRCSQIPACLFQLSEVILPSCVSVAPQNLGQKQQRHIRKILMVARCAAQISLEQNQMLDLMCRIFMCIAFHFSVQEHSASKWSSALARSRKCQVTCRCWVNSAGIAMDRLRLEECSELHDNRVTLLKDEWKSVVSL